jgi:hypothetical protein
VNEQAISENHIQVPSPRLCLSRRNTQKPQAIYISAKADFPSTQKHTCCAAQVSISLGESGRWFCILFTV